MRGQLKRLKIRHQGIVQYLDQLEPTNSYKFVVFDFSVFGIVCFVLSLLQIINNACILHC